MRTADLHTTPTLCMGQPVYSADWLSAASTRHLAALWYGIVHTQYTSVKLGTHYQCSWVAPHEHWCHDTHVHGHVDTSVSQVLTRTVFTCVQNDARVVCTKLYGHTAS